MSNLGRERLLLVPQSPQLLRSLLTQLGEPRVRLEFYSLARFVLQLCDKLCLLLQGPPELFLVSIGGFDFFFVFLEQSFHLVFKFDQFVDSFRELGRLAIFCLQQFRELGPTLS